MLALWGQDKHQQIKHIKASVFSKLLKFTYFLKLMSLEANRMKKAATFLMLIYFDNW